MKEKIKMYNEINEGRHRFNEEYLISSLILLRSFIIQTFW